MSVSPYVFDVTEANFESAVVAKSHEVPVVVDFWAAWCGPCRALGPVLEKLAARDEGRWVLAKVDTETNRRLAQAFGIQGIPNVKAIVKGKVVDEFSGAIPEHAVDQWLKKLVPSAADQAVAAARELEAGGDVAAAVARYVELLGEDPENATARAALVLALVQTGDLSEARTLVDEIPNHQWNNTQGQLERAWLAVEAATARREEDLAPLAAQGDLEARFELAMRKASRGDLPAAFEDLLFILATDRSFRDDIGRVAMVRLFAVAGDDSAVTNKYRSRMGAVMYV